MSQAGFTQNSELTTQNAGAAQPHPQTRDIKGAALAWLAADCADYADVRLPAR